MARVGQISPAARSENIARLDLRIAFERLAAAASAPIGTVEELMNALDRYVDAKLQPRRF